MSGNFFKKMQDDMKKNFEAFSDNVGKAFGIPPKNAESSKTEGGPEATSAPDIPNTPTTSGAAVDSVAVEEKFTSGWNKFVTDSKSNFEKMQAQWQSQFDKIAEKSKENTEKVTGFFQNQQQKMNETLQTMESDMKNQTENNRENFFQSMEKSAENWDSFVVQSQNKFEKNLSEINSAGWKAQVRVILFAIPILIVAVLIFRLIGPYIV